MTTAAIGWFVAGIFFAAFIIFWFSTSSRELSEKRRSFDSIAQQVAMHRKLCMQERGGENDAAAKRILSAKLAACVKAEKEYNALLKNPIHRIPAYILGFRPIEKGGNA